MNIFLIIHILISVALITSVLLQSQGSGLGGMMGGGGETFHTRRGLEKVLFYATIVLVVAFTISSAFLLFSR